MLPVNLKATTRSLYGIVAIAVTWRTNTAWAAYNGLNRHIN